ncbi:hypothetical protein FB005_10952 [Sinorhizobium medicae]|uniref:Uncharacterized protein n=1 Tax=Sinorhizobium medicae TaxID=110321 RepID=A0A508WWY9_9HYPH|nr:hypothetical protein FB006_10952 [Sinorhizobium medicae]TWA43060.1 hypothetical protein FB005_10952 [Sinorhizobium medicae]TWA50178.1 hypothetical protein FB008_11322 [Sinorhizobium medicae]VTZ60548.1 hypothetical protein EMEDMD4_170042 [Sinorhizobium medicae]
MVAEPLPEAAEFNYALQLIHLIPADDVRLEFHGNMLDAAKAGDAEELVLGTLDIHDQNVRPMTIEDMGKLHALHFNRVANNLPVENA